MSVDLVVSDCSILFVLFIFNKKKRRRESSPPPSSLLFIIFFFSFCQRSKRAYIDRSFLIKKIFEHIMSSSIENRHSDKSSSPSLTSCDNRTCSTAKCALCLHCSQQYCFVHFLKHNEQLSINALNLTLVIDQLGKRVLFLAFD